MSYNHAIMATRIILVLILMSAVVGWVLLAQENTDPIDSQTAPAGGLEHFRDSVQSGTHPCEGTERCLVVYLAPWCPHCNSSIPLVREIRDQIGENDDTGMMVIVGPLGGSFAGYDDMARRLDGPVYLDRSGEAWEDYLGSLSGVPAWAVFDGRGQITQSFTGGTPQSSQAMVQHVLTDQLGLAAYFED